MDTQHIAHLGFAHFVTQADILAQFLLALLLLLSIGSWYLIITKGLANFFARRRAAAFLHAFRQAGTAEETIEQLRLQPPDQVFAELAHAGLDALDDASTSAQLAAAGGFAEYLTRTLNHRIDHEAARVEHGMTLLAAAGSAAPYIGLFGTVWGIYHALVQIGLSGQGTLDKVAGPVGEALIMTALGLAVAIPAVLAHSAFSRRNRLWLAQLEGFAHDLYVLLTVKRPPRAAATASKA
uniref:Biopolymer transport protein ExbB n=1 Tax=uncultured bacterium UPO46 TaxID=1776971 RepID=A0A126SY67_9BACT|nr:MotA/TolQ/ExbB proton channel [uncultured bacterium UPO46]